MSVAVILFGHLRTYKDCFPSLDKYLFSSNPDVDFNVYIHTWNTNERHTSSFYDVKYNEITDIEPNLLFSSNNVSTKVVVDSQNLDEDVLLDGTMFSKTGLMAMHKTLRTACKLSLENKNEHSAYIVLRPDVLLKKKMLVKDWCLDVNDSHHPEILRFSYFTYTNSRCHLLFDKIGATDLFFIANQRAVEVFCHIGIDQSLYDISFKYFGEDHFNEFILQNRIRANWGGFIAPYDWALLRKNGESISKPVAIFRELKVIYQRTIAMIKLIYTGFK